MKGVVFTEFLGMVEQRYSAELADDIIEDSELASGGVFTAVGISSAGSGSCIPSSLASRPARDGVPIAERPRRSGPGLIRGALDHFGETASVVREDVSADGSQVRFGGDEILIRLNGVLNVETVLVVAEKMRRSMSESLVIAGTGQSPHPDRRERSTLTTHSRMSQLPV